MSFCFLSLVHMNYLRFFQASIRISTLRKFSSPNIIKHDFFMMYNVVLSNLSFGCQFSSMVLLFHSQRGTERPIHRIIKREATTPRLWSEMRSLQPTTSFIAIEDGSFELSERQRGWKGLDHRLSPWRSSVTFIPSYCASRTFCYIHKKVMK